MKEETVSMISLQLWTSCEFQQFESLVDVRLPDSCRLHPTFRCSRKCSSSRFHGGNSVATSTSNSDRPRHLPGIYLFLHQCRETKKAWRLSQRDPVFISGYPFFTLKATPTLPSCLVVSRRWYCLVPSCLPSCATFRLTDGTWSPGKSYELAVFCFCFYFAKVSYHEKALFMSQGWTGRRSISLCGFILFEQTLKNVLDERTSRLVTFFFSHGTITTNTVVLHKLQR